MIRYWRSVDCAVTPPRMLTKIPQLLVIYTGNAQSPIAAGSTAHIYIHPADENMWAEL